MSCADPHGRLKPRRLNPDRRRRGCMAGIATGRKRCMAYKERIRNAAESCWSSAQATLLQCAIRIRGGFRTVGALRCRLGELILVTWMSHNLSRGSDTLGLCCNGVLRGLRSFIDERCQSLKAR